MTKSSKKVHIPPDPSIFTRLAATNMPIERAIAELVDNSIDSFLANRAALAKLGIQGATVKVTFGQDVTVADNCSGMLEQDLIDAFCLGKSKKGKIAAGLGLIGRYGLGMKAASMVLGKRMTVRTKTASDDKALELTLDADGLEKHGWYIDPPKSVKVDWKHGTEVVIGRLHRTYSRPTRDRVIETCARLFRHYIKSGDLHLLIDDMHVAPHEEATKPGTYRELSIKLGAGEGVIKGWVGMMNKVQSHSGNYGFTLVRNKRVVDEYVKIGIRKSNWESKIVGELFLDNWDVDFTKARIPEHLPGYVELDEKLRKDLKPELLRNKKDANPGKDKEKIVPDFDTKSKMSEILKLLPENIKRSRAVLQETGERARGASDATIKKYEEELESLLVQYDVKVIFERLGREHPILAATRNEETGYWECRINLDRPFVTSLGNNGRQALASLFAAQIIAEQEMSPLNRDRLRMLQNTLLAEAERGFDGK